MVDADIAFAIGVGGDGVGRLTSKQALPLGRPS
jgi:hypothetical protein